MPTGHGVRPSAPYGAEVDKMFIYDFGIAGALFCSFATHLYPSQLSTRRIDEVTDIYFHIFAVIPPLR